MKVLVEEHGACLVAVIVGSSLIEALEKVILYVSKANVLLLERICGA